MFCTNLVSLVSFFGRHPFSQPSWWISHLHLPLRLCSISPCFSPGCGHPQVYVVFLWPSWRRSELCSVSVMSPLWCGQWRGHKVAVGPGAFHGRTWCRAESWLPRLISEWVGELLSAGWFLTNQVNLICLLSCGGGSRPSEESLSMLLVLLFIGPQKLCLVSVTSIPGPPKNVSTTYQPLAKWSGKGKIKIPAKTRNSKTQIVSRTEYAKMLRRILWCRSWLPRSLHSTARRTSPGHLPPCMQTFGSPSHYSSAPCSHAPICCLMIILRLIFEVWSQEV